MSRRIRRAYSEGSAVCPVLQVACVHGTARDRRGVKLGGLQSAGVGVGVGGDRTEKEGNDLSL